VQSGALETPPYRDGPGSAGYGKVGFRNRPVPGTIIDTESIEAI